MKRTLLILAVAAATGLVSCSKEDSTPSTTVKNELGVTAMLVQSGQSTRALVSGTTFASGSSVKVFVAKNGTAYTGVLGTYTYDGTNWLNSAHSIQLTSETGNVYAYSPTTATLTSGSFSTTNPDASTIDINLLPNDAVSGLPTEASFTGAGQTDYLYGTSRTGTSPNYTYPLASVSNVLASNSANLYFHHGLSKVTFIINKGNSYSGIGAVSKLKLSSGTAVFSAGAGTLKLNDGTLTWSGSKANTVVYTGTATINSTTASTTPVVTGLVAPTGSDITSAVTLTITVDGNDMTATLPKNNTGLTGISWLPGNDYQYTVTVNGSELVVNSVSIIDWNVNNITGSNPINVQQ